MAIDLEQILALRTPRRRYQWQPSDSILYALSVGYGIDPLDEYDLSFVTGEAPTVVPTMATVLAWGIGPDRKLMGIDYTKVVHGEQRIVLHQPLEAAGVVMAEARVSDVFDKGEGRGAIILVETNLFGAQESLVATLTNTLLARNDGGFGGPPMPTAPPSRKPSSAPDQTVECVTRPEQALIYRLNGDTNPLHSNPETARKAGFPRPILHGLCTYGVACRAVLKATGHDPSLLYSHSARFSAPVFPGDTILVDIWELGASIAYEARVPSRNAIVISNGITEFRDSKVTD